MLSLQLGRNGRWRCRATPAFASPRHNRARFGETVQKAYLCTSRKRKSAGFSSFCVFGANYHIWAEKLSYMTVKIISKPVKICSLIVSPRCFIVKNSLIFAGIIKEQISVVLIIPKLLPEVVLTIANASETLCAGTRAALTKFAFLPAGKGEAARAYLRGRARQFSLTAIYIKMATTRHRDEWLPHRTYIEMKKLFFPCCWCKFTGDDFFLQIFSEKIRGNSTKRRFLPMN